MKKALTALLAVSCSVWMLAAAASAPDVDTLLHQAVAGSWRSDAHKARDQYRHPIETLEFFGLQPGMTVVELAPGGGWYTEVLAPVLKDDGHLIEAAGKTTGKYADMLQSNKATFGDVKIEEFSPPTKVNLGADGSADMVVTFRNLHDWLNDDPKDVEAVFKAAFDVLKPGGILGIEEHRGRPNMDPELSSKSLHRIPEDYVIELGLKTGFQLAGISQINANPKDDGTKNVHLLLPDFASNDESLKPIGESDRMTLKFVKPKQ
ncbi:MAG TPA: hypothetical protein VGO35_06440 [Gammaproteobacteria bacterium]|nr:hypothetical protein [Gammaproteobacteria bacterium]